MTARAEVRACESCGRTGEHRHYGDTLTSLQTGHEEWGCADYCGAHSYRRFVLEATGRPEAGRRYVSGWLTEQEMAR